MLVVLSNPPLGTTGQRTLGRVATAGRLINAKEIDIANLFSIATYRTSGVSLAGAEAEGWVAARSSIEEGLDRATDVLLAYGTQEPSGKARHHHRAQVEWLKGEIMSRSLTVWAVGERTGHPSRWQRLTFSRWPELDFISALARELKHYSLRE
ncbi:hypothetical protein GCM10027416_04590 [Okibacterium endophyticum]